MTAEGYFRVILDKKDELIEQLNNELESLKSELALVKKEYDELAAENNILINKLGCDTCDIHLQFKNLNKTITESQDKINRWKDMAIKLDKDLSKVRNPATLKYQFCFINDEDRDNWDLLCSCGAMFDFNDKDESESFSKYYKYCPVCGGKWKM